MNAGCEGVLENLDTCMQQGIATSPKAIEPPCNTYLSMIERCDTIPLSYLIPSLVVILPTIQYLPSNFGMVSNHAL